MSSEAISREFHHVVTDADECVDVENPFEFDDAPAGSISMSIGKDGFWLSATREGYLHLARVCAEMALRDFGEAQHFHVGPDFGPSSGAPEFTFELSNGSMEALA